MNSLQPPRRSVLGRVFEAATLLVDRRWGWHRLPTPLGLFVLIGFRNRLRRKNLYDTTDQPSYGTPPVKPFEERHRMWRSDDGTYNDLEHPAMGMAGSRFGRNVPIERTFPDPQPLWPNPREISLKLLTRDEYIPATSVNALVTPWLQFMIQDWFSHGHSPPDNPWVVPLGDQDDFPERPMIIPRTPTDPTRPQGTGDLPPTWVNTETHWWDGSQIYGSDAERQEAKRTGQDGKLHVRHDGLLPVPEDPEKSPASRPGFWTGLAMLHTIFTLEHNSICDRLRADYPTWSDENLFQHARLVLAALLAKIHTVEWTPAVISHPTTRLGLRANWWGLAGERVYRHLGRISSNEVISGIMGSRVAHYGVPFCLTEEFVAVYRMHPLVPDDFSLRSAADDSQIRETTFRELTGPSGFEVMQQVAMPDLFYSMGTMHPGLVTLHNFPKFLQEFERPDGDFFDMGAVDILRTRELGVPRYNEFRRLLHLKPVRDFESLTDNPQWAEQIRDVYNNDIEAVDLMVGLYAEPRPAGFAFSDTAFRIFVLMASRRLNSDRFFTDDYREEVYTRAGMDWIDHNTFKTVLSRHYPVLADALRGVDNAFVPWQVARA